MVDMGYLDEETLWKVLEEQKRSGSELLGKVAVRMGLVKEDQVLKALGEQLGMKVVKLADITIPAELTELVNESMATAYKIVPVSQNKKDKSLTVAMAEPQNPSTLDSLKMFLSTEVKGAIATEADVMAAIERLYAGHHESIQDVVKQIEQDKGLSAAGRAQREHDRPRGDRRDGRGRAGAQAAEHGACSWRSRTRPRTSTSSRSRKSTRCGTGSTGCSTSWSRRRATWPRRSPAASRSCPTSTSPSGGCRRTAGSSSPWAATRSISGSRPCRRMFGESVVLRILDRTVVQLDLKKLGMPEDTLKTVARDHREAQRHRPGDRPDLLGQDDDALRHARTT